MNELKYDGNFIDMDYLIDDTPEPFLVIVGARGIGKSYGAFRNMMRTKKKFLFMRITDKELKLCASEAGNPFKKLNRDLDMDYHFNRLNEYMYGIYNGEDNLYSAVACSLSLFSKIRGVDFSDITHIVLDEFICEKIVKRTPGIGEALLQAYETVNRNRELEGEPPVKLILMANALNINNEILIILKLVSMLQRMKKKQIECLVDQARGIRLICPFKTPISELKRETVLYKLNQRFNDMAINNQFREYYDGNVKSEDLRDKTIMCGFDNMFFYKDNDKHLYYVSPYRYKGKKIPYYKNTDYEIKQFRLTYHYFITLYYQNRIRFESSEIELDFINLFDIK